MTGEKPADTHSPKTPMAEMDSGLAKVATPPQISPITTGVSPNTRALLNTFNTINYNVSSAQMQNEWTGPSQLDQSRMESRQLDPSRSYGRSEIISDNGLLSLTESSALESFLDSIANDNSGLDKLAKQWEMIDPGASNIKPEREYTGFNGYSKETSSLKRKSDDQTESQMKRPHTAAPQRQQSTLLTEHERKQNHMVSEQKRRASIKDAFVAFGDLVEDSQFRETKTHKRQSKSVRKSMSKYNVLNRSVVEVEKLQALNRYLKKALNK